MINSNQEDIQQVDRLNEEAWDLRRTHPTSALEKAERARGLSKSLNHQKGEAEALRTKGYCYWRFNDFVISLQTTMEAIEIFEKIDDKKGKADCLNTVGIIYVSSEEYETGISNFEQSLKIRQDIGDREGEAISLSNIGECYMKIGDYDKALIRLQECWDLPDIILQTKAAVLCYIGEAFFHIKKNEKAIRFLKESIKVAKEIKYDRFIMLSLFFLGKLYFESDKIKALSYLAEANEYAERSKDKSLQYKIHLTLSELHDSSVILNLLTNI